MSAAVAAVPPRHVHGGQPVQRAGRPLREADLAMVMVHGRGGSAVDILTLAREWPSSRFAYLAPQAAGHSWYSHGFMAPLEANQPGLDSGLARLGEVLAKLEAVGIPAERTVLLGFSQGACLALEYAARHARRYAGLVALSGGLIGPDGTPRDHGGDLAGTPVLLGCSDRDPHIPLPRVQESTAVLRELGGEVEERIYPRMPHTVNRDEVSWVAQLVRRLEDTTA